MIPQYIPLETRIHFMRNLAGKLPITKLTRKVKCKLIYIHLKGLVTGMCRMLLSVAIKLLMEHEKNKTDGYR